MLIYSRKDKEWVFPSEKIAKKVDALKEKGMKFFLGILMVLLCLLCIGFFYKPLESFSFILFATPFSIVFFALFGFFLILATTDSDEYFVQFDGNGNVLNYGENISKISGMKLVQCTPKKVFEQLCAGKDASITQEFWNGESGLRKTFKLVPKDGFNIEELLVFARDYSDENNHFDIETILYNVYKTKVWDEREMHAHTSDENGIPRIQWIEDNPFFVGGVERIEIV